MNLLWNYQECKTLSYDLLNVILSPSNFVHFNENFMVKNGTSSHQKCYVTCGHNIIYDMMLSTE